MHFSKVSSGNIYGEENATCGGPQETRLTGHKGSRPLTGHFATPNTLGKKSPMLGCTDGSQVVPQLLPRYIYTHKMVGANPKSENWKWTEHERTQKHIAPTAHWQSFLYWLFGKMMTPCYLMASLCRETIKRRWWIWINRRLFRLVQQDCWGCTQ